MAIKLLKIKKWGPPALWSRLAQIQDAINERTPRPGIGISIDEKDTGAQISTKLAQPTLDVGLNTASGGGSGGSTPAPSGAYIVLATEFVPVSNAGTAGQEMLFSHGIGTGRMVANGDSLRATYSVSIESGSDSSNLSLRFGNGNVGDLVIGDGNNMNLDSDITVKIEALVMRVSGTTYRYITSILVSTNFSDTSIDTQFVRCNTEGPSAALANFASDQFFTLWAGGERMAQATAKMALIEYVPA